MEGTVQLSPMDAAFLYHERPEQRLHVGSLLLLDGAVPYDDFTELTCGASPPCPDPRRTCRFGRGAHADGQDRVPP